MNKYKKILITSLFALLGISSSIAYISNVEINVVEAAKTVKKLSPSSEYPNIKDKYDITNMSQYNSNDLMDGVTLNKFYVKDWGYDKYMGDRHLLLTPTKNSNQYFLVVTKTKKVFVGDRITVQGGLNGLSKVNHAQIKSGIQNKYLNKPDVLVLADKVAIYHTK